MDNSYLIRLLKEISDIMSENRDHLIEMDSIVGDGDLGLTMGDGFKAVYEKVADGSITDAGKLLYQAGKAMASAVPSTMGTLMASGLMQAGKVRRVRKCLRMPMWQSFLRPMKQVLQTAEKPKWEKRRLLTRIHPAVEVLMPLRHRVLSLEKMAAGAVKAAEDGFKNTTAPCLRFTDAPQPGERLPEVLKIRGQMWRCLL